MSDAAMERTIKTDAWCPHCGNVGWLEKVDGTWLCHRCANKVRDDKRIFFDRIRRAVREAFK